MSLATHPRRCGLGQHRRTARRRAVGEPERPLRLLMSGLGALIVAAVCGLTGFVVVADARQGAGSPTAPPADVRAIASRGVDPRPLSLAEVFPDPQVTPLPGAPAYRIGITHIDSDCASATTGTLGWLVAGHGCTQVVRADLTAPYGGYQVTAGILNLIDAGAAALFADQTSRHVEAGDGSFAALGVGATGADPTAQPLSQVGWQARGHYLVYCVITRPDRMLIGDDDPDARRITADLVRSYLEGAVIDRRALHP